MDLQTARVKQKDRVDMNQKIAFSLGLRVRSDVSSSTRQRVIS